MKRIALTLATLALSAGAAFAATPAASTSGMSGTTAPASHHAMPAVSRSHDHTAQRMTSALNLLEAKGYASFNDFKADGKDFTATVMKNGHDTTVRIDPDSGQITAQS